MSIRARSTILASAALVALAACSSGDTSSTAATSPSAESPAPSSPSSTSASETPSSGGGTEIESEDSALGVILTDGSGNTLYAFLPDDQGASTCYDDCAASWPALLAEGDVEVSGNDEDATDLELVGTVERDDGGMQVTYNGWPLYHFGGDQASGDTNGQGVGDVWYVVSPEGDPITG